MKEHSRTVGPVACPKCRRSGEAEAALHDFDGAEAVALRCPLCRHVWRAPAGLYVRNPDGSTHVVAGTDEDASGVRAFGPP